MFSTLISRIKWLFILIIACFIFVYITGGASAVASVASGIGHFFGAVIGGFINIVSGATHGAHLKAPKVKL